MTTPETGPAEKLTELLETAPPEVRREITRWLMQRTCPPAPALVHPWHSAAETPEQLRRLIGGLAPGEGSQLVTIRLPAERHATLREWCAEHGFSMAAVVRGLVERFLEEQASAS